MTMIPHDGKGMPVAPDVSVEVRLRGWAPSIEPAERAGNWSNAPDQPNDDLHCNWTFTVKRQSSRDIVAYRIVS